MFEVSNILLVGGLLAIAAIVFAESALLLGLFLPGDTLLIAGGVYASQDKLPLLPLIIIAAISTIAGYQVGYMLGRRAGPHIFKRKDGVLFRKDYIAQTEVFFTKHGRKTVLIARFIAIVRTIVPLIAGMGKMNKRKFLLFNILGGILWSSGIILISYWAGTRIENLDNYLKYFVLAAILLTSGSLLIELMKNQTRRRDIFRALKEEYRYLFKKT